MLAPTDSAFAVLSLDDENICQTNRTALNELLHYHLIDGNVASSEMTSEGPLGTGGITISSEGLITGEKGGEAIILASDLYSSNGMIQAIDAVLMPFSEDTLTGGMFPDLSNRDTPDKDDTSNEHIEVAALSAGLAAALILVAAAIAVHKRRQADAAKPPQVAPDDGGWGTTARGAAVHPA